MSGSDRGSLSPKSRKSSLLLNQSGTLHGSGTTLGSGTVLGSGTLHGSGTVLGPGTGQSLGTVHSGGVQGALILNQGIKNNQGKSTMIYSVFHKQPFVAHLPRLPDVIVAIKKKLSYIFKHIFLYFFLWDQDKYFLHLWEKCI